MACTPHLFFLVVVFSLIILYMACPSGGLTCCVFVRLVGNVGCKFLKGVLDCGSGNRICACSNASLMVLGACLCMLRNFSGVSMTLLVLFWICGRVVMPYVYNLSRNFWDFALSFSVRLAYKWCWISKLIPTGFV